MGTGHVIRASYSQISDMATPEQPKKLGPGRPIGLLPFYMQYSVRSDQTNVVN